MVYCGVGHVKRVQHVRGAAARAEDRHGVQLGPFANVSLYACAWPCRRYVVPGQPESILYADSFANVGDTDFAGASAAGVKLSSIQAAVEAAAPIASSPAGRAIVLTTDGVVVGMSHPYIFSYVRQRVVGAGGWLVPVLKWALLRYDSFHQRRSRVGPFVPPAWSP